VNSSIEVCGIVEYSNLEGGFFYLNAECWTYAATIMPELQSFLLMPLFTLVTLLAVIVFRKEQTV
jgi:hypothetical protein